MHSYDRVSSDDEVAFIPSKQRNKFPEWITYVSLSINLVFLLGLVFLIRPTHVPHAIYSPAPAIVSPLTVTFHHSWVSSPTKYRGFGEEVDKAWQDLYSAGSSILTEGEANQLPNATEPIIVGGQKTYSALLAVFHDLHCLNLLRMAQYPEHYNSSYSKSLVTGHHLEHCIDMVRQTIQCNADVTPLPLRFGPNEGNLLLTYRSDVKRVCRDFEKVRDWAHTRKGTDDFSKVLHIKPEPDN